MHGFTAVFLVALGLTTLARLWLSQRHIRYVLANRNAVPAEFSASIPLAAHQKAAGYTAVKTRLGMLETLAAAALLLGFTLGGGLQFLSDAWERIFEAGGYAHGIALIVSVVLVSSALDLPFGLYRTFVIEARFGFNRMSPALFIADLAKLAALGALIGIPLAFVVLWLMAKTGESWWFYVWLTWVAFNLVVATIYPTLIAPLFNKFSPLEDADLRSRIESLLAKCGFRARGLFVMDNSRRSSHGNAYFTGFGAAKRIVLFDTLISRLSAPEIEAVLAHELGHFSRRHVWKRMGLAAGASLVILWLLGWLIGQEWFYAALGVRTRSTAMALVLFFMVVPVFTFLLQPLASWYSRLHEFEADAYAARVADPRDLARALVKLYMDNATTLAPDPLHSAFYDSHPPAVLRIARLQTQRT
ncbi:MAG: M48 family metallopeptidase [Betaproteobacteria bacterium]|nr:MAG: M48 family metallopeptidase [Betaproteobacteria bacterium]